MARFVWTDSKFEEVTNRLDSIESKLDKVLDCVAVNGKKEVAKAPAKGKAKSKAKATKGKSSSGSFDRALYEATAKKLGVWNDEYGKVTGTWKDGKKVADAKTNRAKVYEAMGI